MQFGQHSYYRACCHARFAEIHSTRHAGKDDIYEYLVDMERLINEDQRPQIKGEEASHSKNSIPKIQA